MKAAKRIMWITAFVSLVGTAAVLPMMPDRVPMHYNAAWEIDRWGSRYENLLLPVMTVGMALFFAALASYYERKVNYGDHYFYRIVGYCPRMLSGSTVNARKDAGPGPDRKK